MQSVIAAPRRPSRWQRNYGFASGDDAVLLEDIIT